MPPGIILPDSRVLPMGYIKLIYILQLQSVSKSSSVFQDLIGKCIGDYFVILMSRFILFQNGLGALYAGLHKHRGLSWAFHRFPCSITSLKPWFQCVSSITNRIDIFFVLYHFVWKHQNLVLSFHNSLKHLYQTCKKCQYCDITTQCRHRN